MNTDLPVAVYPITSLEFTKVVAGQGIGCAITSGGALYCWGCFSGVGTGPAPLWRNADTRDTDVYDSHHCVSDTDLPSGPFLPTLVRGMESGVTHVTHLSTMGSNTKQHMGLALKSGNVYELYLDTSKDLIASRLKNSFSGIFTVVADTRQQGNPYACALQGSSIYCHTNDGGSTTAPISGLPIDFRPVSVHCSHFWQGWDSQHCCTYNSDGIVYCWGKRNGECVACNRLGDIGADLSTNSVNIAVHATVVSSASITVASGQSLVISMDIGYVATHVVGGDGKIYCWSCRNSVTALTKIIADPPHLQKYVKLALGFNPERICALTDASSLYCAIVPLTYETHTANMIQVTSVRNFKRAIVTLASASSGVIDVSCSKNFGANAPPYLACCIIIRSSLGSNSGAVHCTVRATCTCFFCDFMNLSPVSILMYLYKIILICYYYAPCLVRVRIVLCPCLTRS
jgi:hypothetical protein